MIAARRDPPALLLQRLGVTELLAVAAVGAIIALQYVFLGKLWEGYLIRWAGDAIHPFVVATGVVLSLGGAAFIAVASLRRWRRGAFAARRLERPATHASFAGVREILSRLAARSSLTRAPSLEYTPRNAGALEVREDPTGQVVVAGLGVRGEYERAPESLAAKLGHEISHLELHATGREIAARRAVLLHFRVFAWLALVFLLSLTFIDRRGLDSESGWAGLMPVFDISIYVDLSSQIAALLLTAGLAFAYAHFPLVRREHIHDFRGSQLAGTDVLATQVFAAPGPGRTIADFLTLHPTTPARRRVVIRRDFILLSAVAYPAIVAAIVPLGMLLTAGWRELLGIESHWWNLGQTIIGGLLLFLVLRADLVRLGLGLVLRTRIWLLLPVYALVAAAATQVPRIVLETLYGLREGMDARAITERIVDGVLAGGQVTTALVAATLVALALVSGVRIAATGEDHAGRFVLAETVAAAFIVLCAFAISSLTSLVFAFPVMAAAAGAAGLFAVAVALLSRCAACGRVRTGSLLLNPRCPCGHDAVRTMRRWIEKPYNSHLE